jgi:tRNA (cytidine56-2'-O)-methyltransferase
MVVILRLDHRPVRDARVTTHALLVARAFGAAGALYSGVRDKDLEEGIREVVERWGGPFDVGYERDWTGVVRDWKEGGGEVVHLTVYGVPIQDVIPRLRSSSKDKLVVVGGAKVPRLAFDLADWNVSVTSQPHSEVAALAIFLHELFEGREMRMEFRDAKMRVTPSERGKKVVRLP